MASLSSAQLKLRFGLKLRLTNNNKFCIIRSVINLPVLNYAFESNTINRMFVVIQVIIDERGPLDISAAIRNRLCLKIPENINQPETSKEPPFLFTVIISMSGFIPGPLPFRQSWKNLREWRPWSGNIWSSKDHWHLATVLHLSLSNIKKNWKFKEENIN